MDGNRYRDRGASGAKILVTLGPSSMSREVVRAAAGHGVYVFRINLSHTAIEDVGPAIDRVQSWTDVPICLDSEGAQLRNQKMINEEVAFSEGERVKVHYHPVVGDSRNISFTPAGIARQFRPGDVISIDFNHVKLRIDDTNSDHCQATVICGGWCGSNKAADMPRDLDFDPLTQKDRQAIEIGLEKGVSNFALSFTNKRQDVEQMRRLTGPEANIICKIESPSGIENLESILEEADEILIDRGDLSRKVPIEKVPFLQRRIISMARSRRTPVFVATNLLESMVTHMSPNRAEVNDVVSTLEMGANGLVLAAETAIGSYPVEAVGMIRRLIDESESWTPNTSIAEIIRC